MPKWVRGQSSPNPNGRPRKDRDFIGPKLPKMGIKERNIRRVRLYLMNNLGCSQKEVARALSLNACTVRSAIYTIRGKVWARKNVSKADEL